MSNSNVIDYAIVGGGVSGLYSAWRLAASRPGGGQGVHVFEMGDRVGGRLETIRMAGMPHVPTDLGGMRILKTQPIACKLIDLLALPTVTPPSGGQSSRVYLRGRHFEADDYADPSLVPYDLRDDEEGLSPSQLVAKAVKSVIPGADGLNPQALRAACDSAVLNGAPLRQHGFWQVLSSALSVEARHLALAGCGHPSMLTNWNAAEATCRFMAGWSPRPGLPCDLHLRDGCDTLPLTLWERFADHGGRVHLRQELIAFDRHPDGCYRLTFADVDTGQEREIAARRLILAMPRRSLKRLAERGSGRRGASPFFDRPGVGGMIDSVQGHPLRSLALAYAEPWWHEPPFRMGEAITDLPLRHVRYRQTEGDQPGADPRNRNSVLVASYAGGLAADFWNSIRGSGPRFDGLPNDFVASSRPARSSAYAVSALMVNEADRQLAALHRLEETPRAYDAVLRDWSDDPYGGGWHSWNIGVNAVDVMRRILRPVADEDVFICGEAYSTHQGWIEGALQTAEALLTGHLGLEPLFQPLALAS